MCPSDMTRELSQSQALAGLEVVTRPGAGLPSQPLPGDIIVRVIEGGTGLVHPDELAVQGLQVEADAKGGYVYVVERVPITRIAAEGVTRRLTGTAGRLLTDVIFLRVAFPWAFSKPVPTPSAGAAPSPMDGGPQGDAPTRNHLDPSQLTWPGASAAQLDLMRRVYLRQVTAACQSRVCSVTCLQLSSP